MHQAQEPERLTLTIEEAAQRLGIGRNTAYEAARLGQIPTIRLGRRLLVPRVALETLLANPATAPGLLAPSLTPAAPRRGPGHRLDAWRR